MAVAERYAHLTAADSAAAAAALAAARGDDANGDANGDGGDARLTRGERGEPLVPPTLAEYNLCVKNAKRSLSTLKTVWGTMLMQVAGLGPEMAQAIIDAYPTPSALNVAYGACGGGKQAAGLLAGLHTSRTHTVGKVVSERVFTSLFGHSLTPLAAAAPR